MPELILRTRHADGRTVAQPLSEFAALIAEPGATYTIVDAATQETPEGLSFERKDEDLEIHLEGEPVILLDDFYGTQTSALFGTDGSLDPSAELALSSGDLPAVSEAGAIEDLPHVSDGGFFSIPAGATLLNPATWGTGALVGAGTAVAAGVGTGVGVAVSDDDDDDAPGSTAVVFDLADTGLSSDHSDRTFDPDTTYTIYIRVSSEAGIGSGLARGQQWSGAQHLGADDTIVLVGDGGPVQSAFGSDVTTMSASSESDWIYWFGSESWVASVEDGGWFYRATLTTTTFSIGSESSTTSQYPTSTSTQLWTSESEGWSTNPNADNTFAQAHLTTMPAGVLTSQGLTGVVL